MNRPSIAIIGINRFFSEENRIRNEVQSLGSRYLIEGYGEKGVDGVRHFHTVCRPPRFAYRIVKIIGGVFPQLRIWFEQFWYRDLVEDIKSRNFRFLIPHNIDDGLIALATGIPFIFHSHEYLPRQFDGSFLFRSTEIRYRRLALQKILNHAALVIVEGDTVAKTYASKFRLPIDKFHIMSSMPAYRSEFDHDERHSTQIRLIHHGFLVPERGIELLIDIVAMLGKDYHLTLMGPGSDAYINELSATAKRLGNVTILPPVSYENIVETLSDHDLGLVVFGSPHFHHKYMTVPNKFWECLQARVPVLVSPESAMADYVRKSGCGIVAPTPTLAGYVNAIRDISPEQFRFMKTLCEEKAWVHSRDSWLDAYAEKLTNSIDAWHNVQDNAKGWNDCTAAKEIKE